MEVIFKMEFQEEKHHTTFPNILIIGDGLLGKELGKNMMEILSFGQVGESLKILKKNFLKN